MKCFIVVVLCAMVSSSSAAWDNIDWSRVRPVAEFEHIRAHIPTPLKPRTIPNGRVVNGQEATPGQFPYQVAILGEFELGVGLCGATVLTNNYILSAAHCMVNSVDASDPIPAGVAIIGAHNRMIEEPSQQRITFTASGVVCHPGYQLATIRHDIGMIRLDEPIVYTERIQPVRLPARSDTRQFGGFIGTVSGFGIYDTANPGLSDVLNYVANPVMTNADCLEYWTPEFIEDQNICHSGAGGRAACNSDSGGPLTVSDGEGSLQVGVVSFGAGACDGGNPTVYARITYYLEWIETNSDFVADP